MSDTETRIPLNGFGSSRASARNLVHYLALRQFDLRRIQEELADLGLSSLGRSEGHVLYNLDTVLADLRSQRAAPALTLAGPGTTGPELGRRLLARNASRLFGRPPTERETRIMVTLPTEAARDERLIRQLFQCGMDCVRINCAHDSEADWLRMIRHVRATRRECGRAGRIEMDLGGPRLRTGPIRSGPSVLKVRPVRDPMGRTLLPGRLILVSPGAPKLHFEGDSGRVAAPADWIRRRRVGDRITLRDTRGKRREWSVRRRASDGILVGVPQTTYLTNDIRLVARRGRAAPDLATVGGIEPRPGRIRLAPGGWIRLSPSLAPGRDRPAGRASRGAMASVGVTVPEVLGHLRKGQRVWFDEGRIGGVVRQSSSRGARVKIDHTPPGGSWLRGDQGINLPDTDLGLPPLTARDRADLKFIVQQADLVGYSFVQSAEDVEALRAELKRLGRPRMGIVLKIETRRAFSQLPAILLSALRSGPTAVMVARGDLAVEVGFDRLAEVQEEMLWLCEAAHLPAIWATQVLEGLAKTGLPSRAEVTDAAMGERAECVMLNKGPYLVEAVRALDSIIRRMQAHQSKKSARLRHLTVAEQFLASERVP